jgi:transmembrane sensor
VDELIIKVLAGMATPAEEARVAEWRAESPENDAHFRVMEGIWAGTAPADQEDVPPVPDAAALRARADAEDAPRQERTVPVTPLASRRRPSSLVSRRMGWGLALAAGIAAISLVVGRWGRVGPVASFAADDSGPRTVTLRDGSVARLAAGSRLEEWDEDGIRSVTLTGRAFFAVTRDPDRPFVVREANVETRVMGTRFEVSEDVAEDIRVVVVEGQVAVSNDDGQVVVEAGAVALAKEGEPPTARRVDDVFALLDWPDGLLIFQETPLAEVAAEVERFFHRSVQVREESLRTLRITARFEGQAFQNVVDALCDVAGASCAFTEDGGAVIGVE